VRPFLRLLLHLLLQQHLLRGDELRVLRLLVRSVLGRSSSQRRALLGASPSLAC
jgi:hypothetical protein